MLDDQELNDLLRQWQAPPAPAAIEEKFFPPAPRLAWWRWLLRGSIRVPVPLAVAAVAVFFALAGIGAGSRRPGPSAR